jgi:protein SCO1
MRYAALLSLLLAAASTVQAQRVGSYGKAPSAPSRPPDLDKIGIDQRLNEQVPLDLIFRDEHNDEVTLGSCVAGKPTVLILAYYECPMLCNQVLNGVVEALRDIPGNVGEDFNVVTVSFDPKDNPGIAWKKKDNYLREYGRAGAENGWHFLTGKKESIDALCQAVGFRYEYDDKKKQFNHASGIMIVTPFGKLSKYFYGIDYSDPKNDPNDKSTFNELRNAIQEASKGMIGKEAPPNRVAKLLCYEYDPISGKYTFTVTTILRIFFGTLLAVIAVWLFRNWRRPTKMATELPARGDSR